MSTAVYKKIEKEMREEDGMYSFAACIAKGIKKDVCPFYVILDDKKIDTNELNEFQIIQFIEKSLQIGRLEQISNVFIETLNPLFKLSCTPAGAYRILQLKEIKKYQKFVPDIIGTFGYTEIIHDAQVVKKFLKKTNGIELPLERVLLLM